MRYLYYLQQKDISLVHSMIPLGSCTMKLNSSAELSAVSWPEVNQIHPFAPSESTKGYQELFKELEYFLCEMTGFSKVSLQPNAGSQGELAGLLVIKKYLESIWEQQRNLCFIPHSAHGTNPASAVMAGLKVVPIGCDSNGNIDLQDLKTKAQKHQKELAALMVTYPSTHGVFEEGIMEVSSIVHEYGGQVYLDGANMNALVGLCKPAQLGMDVCHLNLHKTFSIPHGGGGPGVGPIAMAEHLAPFAPTVCPFTDRYEVDAFFKSKGRGGSVGPLCSTPWGNAAVLPIAWSYIQLLGGEGLRKCSEVAILNANYIAHRLKPHYTVLYRGQKGYVAHECIIDFRPFKKECGIQVMDVAKRLMDYGFHAPTISWPVINTMMIEPTESEGREELDRFIEAMIQIRREIAWIAEGKWDREDNPLKQAPHTAEELTSDKWDHSYTREEAAYPLSRLRKNKFWPPVHRINEAYGDKNLFCSCYDFDVPSSAQGQAALPEEGRGATDATATAQVQGYHL